MTVTTAVVVLPRRVAVWASRRAVARTSVTGIELACALCAAVWFSAGTPLTALGGGAPLGGGNLAPPGGGGAPAGAGAAGGPGAPRPGDAPARAARRAGAGARGAAASPPRPADIVAARDDGPIARFAGALVRGHLVPLPPAVAGLGATILL